uniref:Uncharacterized protein n=1 Tax=Micrurus surinamensis TaxID=129470 RepID=A0A2D4NWV6_MICSU
MHLIHSQMRFLEVLQLLNSIYKTSEEHRTVLIPSSPPYLPIKAETSTHNSPGHLCDKHLKANLSIMADIEGLLKMISCHILSTSRREIHVGAPWTSKQRTIVVLIGRGISCWQ